MHKPIKKINAYSFGDAGSTRRLHGISLRNESSTGRLLRGKLFMQQNRSFPPRARGVIFSDTYQDQHTKIGYRCDIDLQKNSHRKLGQLEKPFCQFQHGVLIAPDITVLFSRYIVTDPVGVEAFILQPH